MEFIPIKDKNMSNGMRDMSRTPLTDKEIEYVKSEIRRIGADENLFIFNDESHINSSTCYNFKVDKVYVTRNIFPDTKYGSTHPRDLMSVGAVLAHEYYGHRTFREEYLNDYKKSCEDNEEYHTTLIWEDECRASITAAKITPNLSEKERSHLIMDAVYRAQEAGHYIEMNDFMKEVVYGYAEGERNITNGLEPITYVRISSVEGAEAERSNDHSVSKVRRKAKDNYDLER